MSDNTIYPFTARKLSGDEISLSAYKDKVLLIVNTASECGFTPQLKDLAALKNEFAGQDFEILAFPSNDFGGQEPLAGDAIAAFCENYGANFPIFDKVAVRGPQASALYKFFADKKQNGNLSSVPRWNFHKFLINKKGEVVTYYYPFTNPKSQKIKKRISKLLADQ